MFGLFTKPAPSTISQILQDYERSLARVVLLCIAETPISLGVSKIVGILRGSKSSFIMERNLHRLSTYGVLPTFSKESIEAIIAALITQRFVEIKLVSEYENLPVLRITPKGKDFLSGKINQIEASFLDKLVDKTVIELDEDGERLFDALRQIRFKIANAKGVPAYMICSDATLRDMAKSKPLTPHALLAIHGVGSKFVENYGETFLNIIRKHA
jgi:ATP-dependent DNA helicase RecQ